MGQLSVYIDDDTLQKVEEAAKNENLSVSKWITNRLKKSFNTSWDEQFFSLNGAIKDASFQRPDQLNFEHDSRRESL